MKGKRLFALRNPQGKYDINRKQVNYFSNKLSAKVARKLLNGTDEEGMEKLSTGYTVVVGPDHWRSKVRFIGRT